MSKISIGLSVIAGVLLSGCLSTPYNGPYEESYEAISQSPAQNRITQRPETTTHVATLRTTPARFNTLRCPAGTRPHAASGSCMMEESGSNLISASTAERASTLERRTSTVNPRWQNIVSETRSIIPTSERPLFPGANYRVRTGDTVYALARARCLPVATVQAINGLDATYFIRVGDALHLPASRC